MCKIIFLCITIGFLLSERAIDNLTTYPSPALVLLWD